MSCYKVEVVEAIALRKCIKFAQDTCLSQILIKSDFLNVVNLINGTLSSKGEIGVIINDIQQLLTLLPESRVHYVTRTYNTTAHVLAKWALNNEELNPGDEEDDGVVISGKIDQLYIMFMRVKTGVSMAAELVVTKLGEAVVSQAVQRIADLLIQEAASLRSVKDDIKNLQIELTCMQSFLKDADRKQEQDELVRIWIAEVRDIACEIEDVIETYIFQVHSSYRKAFLLRKLRTRVNAIMDRLRSINDRRQRYQIEFSRGEGSNSLRNLRRSYPDDEEEDMISLNETTMAMKVQLMKEEDRLCVVSIVGMGGLGKTTLAKKVYNDTDVKKHFDCHAWVFISQQFVPGEVLSEILMQVGFQHNRREERSLGKDKCTKEFLEERKSKREILKGLEDRELVDLLKKVLEDKRYLVILDDIWSIDAWYRIESAFPKQKMGSKVVFTTRIKEVAISADPYSTPIEPPLLTPTESWELLQRKVFPRDSSGECACPSEFEELGKELVGKCGGLPLAIVVLGGLLRTKSSLEGWENVRKYVKSHFINKIKSHQSYRVEDILHLSFQDLPYYLKPCFLYLGTFPEDSEIQRRKLIRLWIAEGFIPKTRKEEVEGTTMEDVANQYLRELIDRYMIQVDKRDHTGKGVKTCRLHDLMRDFCISKSCEEIFFGIMDQNKMNMIAAETSSVQNSTTARSRRITIHGNHGLYNYASWTEQVHPHLRSLLGFGVYRLPTLSLSNKNFVLLRVLVLDFHKFSFPNAKLLTGIGNLIFLRYLRIRGSFIDGLILPHSIGNLRNLHTLDIQNCEAKLPWTMSRLTSLRHLSLPYRYEHARGCPISRVHLFGKYTLSNIETLKGIHARDLVRNGAFLKLSNVRNLKIEKFKSSEEVSLVLGSLHSRLGCLRSLGMYLWEGEFPNLELLSQCHELTNLHLCGDLSLQSFSVLPKGLAKLELNFVLLNRDKLAVLEKLPNLRILQMSYDLLYCEIFINNTSTRRPEEYKWVCSANGFPKLEILKFCALHSLEEWEMEEGAMPNLKRLDITICRQLRRIPEGLKYVTTLLELNISRMQKVFEDRLRVEDGIEGEDYYKVRHIPKISFSHTEGI
ncbi:NB-ARC domain, LRR domain containing protein [Trema orientale]|uniref:NB-ARC domain, LRR domain containing protein n=1 Tax=Trema orientale TaxID=63057 RepID=A0A2P5FLH6_TREOI|nr:NB-ARC domain, LRR domain containing protein [Trema orientale]